MSDQNQQCITEFGRALDSLPELMNMIEETVKYAKDVELQNMKEQMLNDKEAELMAAQIEKSKMSHDVEAATKQVKILESCLHFTEEELMNMRFKVLEVEQQLKQMTSERDTADRMTSFFKDEREDLQKSMNKIKLHMADKDMELDRAKYKLQDQETDYEVLQVRCKHALNDVEQLRKTNKSQQLHVAELESQISEMNKQNSEKKAHLCTVQAKIYQNGSGNCKDSLDHMQQSKPVLTNPGENEKSRALGIFKGLESEETLPVATTDDHTKDECDMDSMTSVNGEIGTF